MTKSIPEPVERPALAEWLWRRNIDLRAAADLFDGRCSPEQVRLICLAFDDPKRRVPGKDLMEVIVARTGGDVAPADFYPPVSPQLHRAGQTAEAAS